MRICRRSVHCNISNSIVNSYSLPNYSIVPFKRVKFLEKPRDIHQVARQKCEMWGVCFILWL